MAKNVWSVFLLLLAFFSGSFFTWTLTMHSLQKCNSQRLAHVSDRQGRYGKGDLMGFRDMQKLSNHITRDREDAVRNDQPYNRTLRRPAVAISTSQHGKMRTSHNSTVQRSAPVRVLCWVMTSPKTLENRASNVRETWGPRCDITLYMSSQANPDFPAIGLDVKEGRDALWNKTKAAALYVYDNHFNDADWFMKADDDTYVIVENLKQFLRDKNNSEAVYYGHNFKKFIQQGYMSGGAGYVLSREALRRLVVRQLRMQDNCEVRRELTQAEDVMLGWCLWNAGVVPGDSRDAQNRSRFLPFDVQTFFNNELPDWYFDYAKYHVKPGRGCCSDGLISIHYVRSRIEMLLLDYYIHGLQRMPQV